MRVDGVEYTPEAIQSAREEVIALRDYALRENYFEWAVLLSHVIAYLGEYSEVVENVRP